MADYERMSEMDMIATRDPEVEKVIRLVKKGHSLNAALDAVDSSMEQLVKGVQRGSERSKEVIAALMKAGVWPRPQPPQQPQQPVGALPGGKGVWWAVGGIAAIGGIGWFLYRVSKSKD